MKSWKIDSGWTLFLDRDGVINERILGDYIKTIEEFIFLDKVPEAITELSKVFGHVFVVTNQQGIGKGVMTERNLSDIHTYMCDEIQKYGGKIDKCYFAPDLASEENKLRKPNPGMAYNAKSDFPKIDFEKSVMIGDSDSDISFGKKLGMKTVRIKTIEPINIQADLTVNSLHEFAKMIK